MRERADALGGQLSAAPKTGGGFRVQATLPIPTDLPVAP
jgi:signal transduction histidine kinase